MGGSCMRGFNLLILFATLLGTACMMSPSSRAAEPARYQFLQRDLGGRVDWGADGRIVFDRQDNRGWFQTWLMDDKGENKKCLTCAGSYPKLHNGNPAWHPSQQFIVFQSADDTIPVPFWGTLYRTYTGPGAGVNNNIWVMTADGGRAWQMTRLGKGKGVLHPHFSPDGTKLLWAEMTDTKPMPTGKWVMRLADFSVRQGVPRITNIRTLAPGRMQFYETHSFSPDGREILFTALSAKNAKGFDIYKYTLDTETLTPLTPPADGFWDEHAQFSPDGSRIIWMSSRDNGQAQKGAFVATDWWMMDADGGNKRRLTYFNKKGAPEYIKGKAVCADISWSPDGHSVIGYLEDNPTLARPGHIVRFSLD